jgi:membrane associated rhomboid family serine protease
MAVCYRHPSRETGVSCSNCGRPICPDCMTSTPVGMRCPECARQTTKVRNLRTTYDRPVVTMALIAINVLVYFGGSTRAGFLGDYGLYGPAVANGDWWRLLTAGFLHGGLLHIGFNMYILWFLGNLLEPALGPVRFLALYLASLLAGSFGALVLSPEALTVGASGAVFGLMGATFVMQRARGIDPMQAGIGPMIVLNLAIGFLPGLNISIGGHLGGLIGGAIAGWLMDQLQARRIGGVLLPIVVCVAIAAVAVAASLARVSGYA